MWNYHKMTKNILLTLTILHILFTLNVEKWLLIQAGRVVVMHYLAAYTVHA